jgi:glycosyltransferase involved in cell wall biosynthesis
MNYRVSIIGSAGIPAAYGGFETLVEHLVRNAPSKESGLQIVVYCSGKGKEVEYKGAILRYINLNPNGIMSIFYDTFSMLKSGLDKSNCLLILGCSGALFIPVYKVFFKGKVVTNVDGIEWRREKWSWLPSNFLKLSEYIAVRFSDEIISDNKAVADYIENTYKKKSIVIPYGGDHVDLSSAIENEDSSKYCLQKYFLGICRIEPENNIKMILDAFCKVSETNLILIGNWDKSEYGISLRKKFQKYKNINLLDPIYNQSELNIYRKNSIGYVHGHSAGGTNPSLVEAMFYSDFILCFDCDFNRITTDEKADYFKNASELIDLIKKPHNKSDNQSLLHKIAMQRYNWSSVSKAYFNLLR